MRTFENTTEKMNASCEDDDVQGTSMAARTCMEVGTTDSLSVLFVLVAVVRL